MIYLSLFMARQPCGLSTMDTKTKATRELHVPGVPRGHEDRPEAGPESQIDASLQDRGGGAPCCRLVRLAPSHQALRGVNLHGCRRACRHNSMFMPTFLLCSPRDFGRLKISLI